jgi:bilin biosynthesis protein
MVNKRFFNIFNLTEVEAIELLDTPCDQLAEDESRYVAASHLINFNTEASIDALIRAIGNTDPELDNRIVREVAGEESVIGDSGLFGGVGLLYRRECGVGDWRDWY